MRFSILAALCVLVWTVIGRGACAAVRPVSYGTEAPPAAGGHPRINLTAGEAEAARARIKSQPAKLYYDLATAGIGKLADLRQPAGKAVAALRAGKPVNEAGREAVASILRDGALAAYLDQDPARKTLVTQALLAFVRGVKAADPGMDLARTAPGVAYGYDYLYDEMTPAQRDEVHDWLVDICAGWYQSLLKQDVTLRPGAAASTKTGNWTPFIVGAFGVTALAVEDEPGYSPEWYDDSVAAMRGFLANGIGPEGAPVETEHYFSYGMSNGAFLLDAMARRGDDILDDPKFQAVGKWWAQDMLPWGRQFNYLDDTSEGDPGSGELMYRLAMKYPSDKMLQLAYANHLKTSRTGPLLNLSAGMLWAPQPTEMTASDAGLPLTAYFAHNGLFYFRSSLSPDASYLQFRSDPAGAGISHSHSDRGAFTFAGKGAVWAVSPGFGAAYDVDQNYVLVDGKGQGYFPEPGKIVAQADAGWAAAALADDTLAYQKMVVGTGDLPGRSAPYNNVLRAYRMAALVHEPHSYAMIADEVVKDRASHTYAWQMLAPLGVTMERVDKSTIMLKPVDSGASVVPDPAVPARSRQPLTVSVPVKTGGLYRVFVLMGKDYWDPWYWGGTVKLDDHDPVRFLTDSDVRAQPHWQAVPLGTGADGAPVYTARLSPSGSPHTVTLDANGSIRILAAMVVADGFDPTGVDRPSPPANAVFVRFSDLASLPTGWKKTAAADKPAMLMIKSLGSVPVNWKADLFTPALTKGRQPSGKYIRIQAVAAAADPNFRLMLYPYRQGDPLPTASSGAGATTVKWPDGTADAWRFHVLTPSETAANDGLKVTRASGGTVKTLTLGGGP